MTTLDKDVVRRLRELRTSKKTKRKLLKKGKGSKNGLLKTLK